MADLILLERIENKILLIRGKKVLLDRDLAELYQVSTKAFNQAVKRNKSRFPENFMFQLSGLQWGTFVVSILIINDLICKKGLFLS